MGCLDNQIVAERAVAFWRDLYPDHTVKHVASRLDAPVPTVAKWFGRTSAPSAGWLLKALRVFGPDFAEAVDPGIGWVAGALSAMRAAHRAALRQALDAADAQEAADMERARRFG